jgi:hypothetical protein
MTFCIMTFSIMTFSIMTFSIMTFSTISFSIIIKNAKLNTMTFKAYYTACFMVSVTIMSILQSVVTLIVEAPL